MSVFLLILKIIGILLLSLLGLALLIILLVLFCPISYCAKGASQKSRTDIRAKAGWLAGLLAVCVNITGENIKSYIRICGIRISFSKKRNKSKDFGNTGEGETTIDGRSSLESKPLAAQELQPQKAETETVSDIPTDNDIGISSHSVFSKIKDAWATAKNVVRSLKDMFTHMKETCGKISSLWENESCKEAIQLIFRQLFSLLGNLKPKKFRLKLSFSTGSPDTTGQLLGMLSLFPMAYQNRWEIIPDFVAEEAYGDAVFDISGRIFGFQILRTVLGIILDKNCRKLYNKLKR